MLRKAIVLGVSLVSVSLAFAAETTTTNTQAPVKAAVAVPAQQSEVSTSPLKISVWPGVWSWPSGNVYGVSFGFPASYTNDKNGYTAGLDMAILLSQTCTKGARISMINMGKGSAGAQIALANARITNFKGMQVGIYNEYKNSEGFQLGIVNRAEKSKGVQFGLVNFMKDGFFPVFPLFNFNCKYDGKCNVDASTK